MSEQTAGRRATEVEGEARAKKPRQEPAQGSRKHKEACGQQSKGSLEGLEQVVIGSDLKGVLWLLGGE